MDMGKESSFLEKMSLPSGRLWIDRSHPAHAVVENFIASGVDVHALGHLIPTRNRMNRMYRIALPGLDAPFVLKNAYVNPGYSWHRRFTRLVRLNFTVPNVTKMELCRRVRAAGIRTLHPVACWTRRVSRWRQEHYFLYPYIHDAISLKESPWMTADDPSSRTRQKIILQTLGRLARRLHEAGLQHVDLAYGNILVDCGWDGTADNPQLTLIDADAFQSSRRMNNTTWRRKADVYSLRRMLGQWDEEQMHEFCSTYARDDHEVWLPIMDYVRRHPKPTRCQRLWHILTAYLGH